MTKIKKDEIEIEPTVKENKNNLLNLLIKNSSSRFTSSISKSKFFNKEEEIIPTTVPMLNVALSGKIDGGLSSGVTIIAGKSKHFKTLFGIFMISAFQQKYENGVVLFFDSEGGTTKKNMEKFGIDMNRVVWTPTPTIEELTHEVVKQMELIKKTDDPNHKVLIFIDSIGNIASSKETEDALAGENKVDMTRAKKIKSFYRIITLNTVLLDIPLIAVNHTYDSQSFIPEEVVGGGRGNMYSANNVWVIGKRKIKDGDEQAGNSFVIKLEKSRICREGLKIPINVYFDKGIAKFGGFDELALEFNIIEESKIGRSKSYKFKDKEILEKDNDFNEEFWQYVLDNSDFAKKVEEKYSL